MPADVAVVRQHYPGAMKPYLTEQANEYVLSLPAGDVAGVAGARGLEADGYFWEGVVRQLVAAKRPDLEARFTYDSDEETFAAESSDRETLQVVQQLLGAVIDNPGELGRLVARSVAAEFMD